MSVVEIYKNDSWRECSFGGIWQVRGALMRQIERGAIHSWIERQTDYPPLTWREASVRLSDMDHEMQGANWSAGPRPKVPAFKPPAPKVRSVWSVWPDWIEGYSGAEPASAFDAAIERLDISVRLLNGLRAAGIETIEQARRLRWTDMQHMRGLGRTSFRELQRAVAEHRYP